MKSIKQLLATADKRTPGEWKLFHVSEEAFEAAKLNGANPFATEGAPEAAGSIDHDSSYTGVTDSAGELILDNASYYPQEVSHDNQEYIANAPLMEAKLREIMDMLPEIEDLMQRAEDTPDDEVYYKMLERLRKWEG